MIDQATARQGERRGTERTRSVLTAGKVVVDGRDFFCLVRNVSAGGLMIEMPTPPAPGRRIQIETAGLNPCIATVVWREDRLCGIEFEAPQDADIICRRGVADAGLIVRGPRFRSDRLAEFITDDRNRVVEVVNISVGGAKLRGVSGLTVNAVGRLIMGSPMPPLLGNVRWAVGEEIGFRFTDALSRDAMAALLN